MPVWLHPCAAFSRRRCSGVASQSSMDRSSPPPGRLAAVLGCHLCFALLCPTGFWFNFALRSLRSFSHGSQQPTIWPSSCRVGLLPTLCSIMAYGNFSLTAPRCLHCAGARRCSCSPCHASPPRGAIPSRCASAALPVALAHPLRPRATGRYRRALATPSARLSLRCTCNRDSRTVVVWYLIHPYITTPRTRQEELPLITSPCGCRNQDGQRRWS